MIKRFDEYHATNENVVPKQLSLWDDMLTSGQSENPVTPSVPRKALDMNQTPLFDNAFSSTTLAHALLKNYEAPKEVIVQSVNANVDAALAYLKNTLNITEASVNYIKTNPDGNHELQVVKSALVNEITSITSDSDYYEMLSKVLGEVDDNEQMPKWVALLLDENNELVDYDFFQRIYRDKSKYDRIAAAQEIAKALAYVDKMSQYDLEDIFGNQGFKRMATETVRLHPNILLANNEYYQELCDYLEDGYDADDKTILIHRAITVPYSVERLKGQFDTYKQGGVGVFWSHAQGGALAHNGDSFREGFTLKLTAEVNVKNVNWFQTLYKSIYTLRQEQEIELKPNTTVNVISFSVDCSDRKRMERSLCDYYLDLDMDSDVLTAVLHDLGDSNTVYLEAPVTVRV